MVKKVISMNQNQCKILDTLQTVFQTDINQICQYNHQRDILTTVIFDWQSIDNEQKNDFVDELFSDWEDDGSLEGIIENAVPDEDYISPKWVEGDWIPFGFANLQLDEDEIDGEDILFAGQFDGVFLVRLSELQNEKIPVYLLEVDGTALNTDPEIFVEDIKEMELFTR